MNSRALALVALLCCVAPAQALTIVEEMRPPLAGSAFSLQIEPSEHGKSTFVITYDPPEATRSVDGSRELVRTATLTIGGADGVVGSVPVAPQADAQGDLVYRFELSDQHARHSQFVIAERYRQREFTLDRVRWLSSIEPSPVAKTTTPRQRTLIIGGGYRYSFQLSDFIGQLSDFIGPSPER